MDLTFTLPYSLTDLDTTSSHYHHSYAALPHSVQRHMTNIDCLSSCHVSFFRISCWASALSVTLSLSLTSSIMLSFILYQSAHSRIRLFFFLMIRPPRKSPLFPSPTLSR